MNSTGSEDVQPSSIFYLLQEATRLASPPEARSLDPETPPEEKDDGPSDDKCGKVRSSGVVCSDGSSAWELMQLINQQCEQLLQSGEQSEDPPDLRSSETERSAIAVVEPLGADACLPSVIYSPETHSIHTDLEETQDLAELIKNSTEDESGELENCTEVSGEGARSDWSQQAESVSPAGARTEPSVICSVDFTSCLVCERDDEEVWAGVDLNNNLLETPDTELQDVRVSEGVCRRAQRKQPHPARSTDPGDPEVLGVKFTMQPEVDTTGQSRLIITSNYSDIIRRSRSSNRSQNTSLKSSTSEEESDSSAASRGKKCASCRTRKTPLWRDAEDGTPLCNACGIRYKKYGVRCPHCWNIPRKEASGGWRCRRCGEELRAQQTQKNILT